MDVNSFRGLSNLNALKADNAFPPPPLGFNKFIIYWDADEATTKKSIQFHPSSRYDPGSKAKPIAITLSMNSR